MLIANVGIVPFLLVIESLLIRRVELVELRDEEAFLLIFKHLFEDLALDYFVDLEFLRERVERVLLDICEFILKNALQRPLREHEILLKVPVHLNRQRLALQPTVLLDPLRCILLPHHEA